MFHTDENLSPKIYPNAKAKMIKCRYFPGVPFIFEEEVFNIECSKN